MKTKYFGIESICIVREDDVTIACNVMLEGLNYSEPIYTNIFCDYEQLQELWSRDNTLLSAKIKDEIKKQLILNNGQIIQINLPDYLDKQSEWNFPLSIELKEDINENIPFQCYRFN